MKSKEKKGASTKRTNIALTGKKVLIAILALSMSASLLTSCNASEIIEKYQEIVPGQTVSDNSKWINSSIEGSMDANTVLNIKDDFYSTVNKDWLLSTHATKEDGEISFATDSGKTVNERMLEIIHDLNDDTYTLPLTTEERSIIKHDRELMKSFVAQAGDWERRNELGAEPLKKYIKAIDDIKTTEQMSNYFLNESGENISQIGLVPFDISMPIYERDIYTLMISSAAPLLLEDPLLYRNIDDSSQGAVTKQVTDQRGAYILGRLGYTPSQVTDIMHKCYRFEIRLSEFRENETGDDVSDVADYDNKFTIEQLKEIQGNYPLVEMLEKAQLSESKSITVVNPEYVKKVGSVFNDSYLEEIKAYCIVHTAIDAMPLLDRDAFDKYIEFLEIAQKDKKKEEGNEKPIPDKETDADKLSEKEREDYYLIKYFVMEYVSRELEEIYAATYCTQQEKQDIKDLTADLIDTYTEMLMNEDWLSDETKLNAVKKLENLSVRAVYPDTFTDFSELDFSKGENLVDYVAMCNEFKAQLTLLDLNQPVNRDRWEYRASNMTVNAFYNPNDNSINILAGILADGKLYDKNAKYEENLGHIGMVIGHEITHAFDNVGSQYDEYGRHRDWWTVADKEAFRIKASRVVNFYNALAPYPGATTYAGNAVQGEAIADMGGVRCALLLGQKQEDFDNDLFFRSYADLWKSKSTFGYQIALSSDVHPRAFIRTNVTLQQFDEFFETYNIKEGDGMYIKPEKRVLIW